MVLALLAGACSPPDGAPTAGGAVPSAAATAAAVPTRSGPDPSAVAVALDELLARRARALASGDAAAFAATLSDPASAAGRAQLAAFRAARALGVSRVAHDVVPPVDDPSAVDVTLRYRVRGVDRADRTATVRYAVRDGGSGWRVAAETTSGVDAAPPWLAMPALAVRRGRHVVVAGTAATARLDEAVSTADRALGGLAAVWERTPARTLVLLPGTAAETDALLGRAGPAVGVVAATTDGPVGADGRATGDRVVLDPAAADRLTATGRDVVLTHELAHVAVRATVPGTAPPWLAEGYADHVGYARAGLPQRTLAAPLAAAVKAGTAPTDLPGAHLLDPSLGDIEVGYLAAWQAVETVHDLRGEAALRRLVRACTVPGGTDDAERACTAAMPQVLGIDRAGLTQRWRARVADLAR